LIQRRNGGNPQKFKIRIGRIEKRKHIIVDGKIKHYSPHRCLFFSPVLVGYQEIFFFSQKRNILTKDSPILAAGKLIIEMEKFGDIQREARKKGSFWTPYFQAGIPVEFCNQSFFP